MRRLTVVFSLPAGLMLVGCASSVPAPSPVQLVNSRLVGQRVCGPITVLGQTFTFGCPPLPSGVSSGWQITPVWTPSVADPTTSHPNRIVTLTVSGPSLTEIDTELVLSEGTGHNRLMNPVDPARPAGVGEVFATSQVGVSANDSGNGKTWTVVVNVSTCANYRHLQIFNRSGSPAARSAPLDVYVFRAENDVDCSGGQPWPQSMGGGAWMGRSGPGDPVRPSPSAPCPGGAQRRLFHVCENCANLHPRSANAYVGYEGCSWSEVLDTFGYTGQATTKPQICTIQQVASREACEGPP
jgi:hypothetical protein